MDWVALSFVQKPADVIEARGLIGDRAGLMTKVEKPQALERIEDIIRLSDAVMVARGDLGVEIPHEDVPGRQKELIRACRLAVKPVVVATQMLDSMVSAPTPTRAEASDVATAIYDGADAVMLSADSATGRYPVETVAMMARIIHRTETHKLYRSLITASDPGEEETPPHAIATATAALADAVHAAAIVAYTLSGTTAARVARRRPAVPILALTPDLATSRRLCLLWGAHSVQADEVATYEDMVTNAVAHAVEEGIRRPAGPRRHHGRHPVRGRRHDEQHPDRSGLDPSRIGPSRPAFQGPDQSEDLDVSLSTGAALRKAARRSHPFRPSAKPCWRKWRRGLIRIADTSGLAIRYPSVLKSSLGSYRNLQPTNK